MKKPKQKATSKPKFQHDCDCCVYLGHFGHHRFGKFQRYDLYWCAEGTTKSLASMLARYGNDGPEYVSSHPPEAFGDGHVPNEIDREILGRAVIRGLYRPWERTKFLELCVRCALSDLECEDPKAAQNQLMATGLSAT